MDWFKEKNKYYETNKKDDDSCFVCEDYGNPYDNGGCGYCSLTTYAKKKGTLKNIMRTIKYYLYEVYRKTKLTIDSPHAHIESQKSNWWWDR